MSMKNNVMFERKKNRAIYIMEKKGMWPSLYAPPCHIFLWRLGFNVAPPPFSSFWGNFLCFTGINTPFWGTVMWFVFWKAEREYLFSAVVTIVTVGVIAGLIMATLEQWRGKANHLPAWDEV